MDAGVRIGERVCEVVSADASLQEGGRTHVPWPIGLLIVAEGIEIIEVRVNRDEWESELVGGGCQQVMEAAEVAASILA